MASSFAGTTHLLDGTDNHDAVLGLIVINPTLESVVDAKVSTQSYDAEFGASAGVVSSQTRSGTNEIHGNGFWFLRNSELQARNPFSQARPIPGTNGRLIPVTQWNQFGQKLYLADRVEAADAIAQFIAGLREEDFLGSDLVRSAVLQKLMIIGEAAAKVSDGIKERHAGIPWADMIGFRNIAAHAYFAMRWPTAWVIASEQVPKVQSRIAAILKSEFPESE